MKRHSAAIALQ